MVLSTLFNDLLALLFPRSCLICGVILVRSELHLCLHCISDIPRHYSGKFDFDYSTNVFAGRIRLLHEAAFLEFDEGNKAQRIVHSLKYLNQWELGLEFGRIIGESLIQKIPDQKFDAIIPVPLHQKKMAKRGYNQSEMLAEGIADKLKMTIRNDILIKLKETKSQTKKTRYERWLNVSAVFSMKKNSGITFNHILLVDDVITTGATLESCVRCIQNKYKCDVSVIALAYTS